MCARVMLRLLNPGVRRMCARVCLLNPGVRRNVLELLPLSLNQDREKRLFVTVS